MLRMEKLKKRAAAAVMAIMAAATGGAAIPGAAAEQTGSGAVGTAATATIDMTKTATLKIHKYDLTAAELAGVDVDALNEADGEKDEDVESAMSDYALEGVQFTYVKAGDILTDTDEAQGEADVSVGVVYSVESGLMELLGLTWEESEKTVTSEDGERYCFSSTQINEALAKKLEGSYLVTKNALESYAREHDGTAMEDTDAAGETAAAGLAPGLYLIVETEVPEDVISTTDPFFVSLPMTDATGEYWIEDGSGNYLVTVYPKNQTDIPTLDKVVRQVNDDESDTENFKDVTTASEGDELEYRIISKIPVVTTDASKYTSWIYEDIAAEGILYDQETGVGIMFYDTKEEAADKDALPGAAWSYGTQIVTKAAYDDADDGDKNSIMAYVSYATDGSAMKVVLTPAGLEAINSDTDTVDPNTSASDSKYQGKYLAVCYSAFVDSGGSVILGDDGNVNDVFLTYGRTNTDYCETIEDKANVYTYGIDLTKIFSEDPGDGHSPSEVSFILRNNTNGQYVTAVPATDTAGNAVAGQYYVKDLIEAAEESDATVFSPDDSGKLLISGLEADEYILTEIATVDGFSLLKEDIVIVITGTEDYITPSQAARTGIDNPNGEVIYVNGERASATVDSESARMSDGTVSTNEYVLVDVINTKSFLLPKTGGFGTLLFSIAAAGGCLAGFGVVRSGKQKNRGRAAKSQRDARTQ